MTSSRPGSEDVGGVCEEIAELSPLLRVAVGGPALAQLADSETVKLLLGCAVDYRREEKS